MPLNVVVAGDSVSWGQGLLDEQKFHTLASQRIANFLGMRENEINVDMRARSGSVIDTSSFKLPLNPEKSIYWREVPWSTPTITEQVELNSPDHTVDLLILGGGINDIGVNNLLDPTHTDQFDLNQNSFKPNLYIKMKLLLKKARYRFPQAAIIVTGYYPIISEYSNLDSIRIFLIPDFIEYLVTENVAKRITLISEFFARHQLYWLRRAVSEMQADRGFRGNGFYFCHPAFGPQHSIGAPNNLLFEPQILDHMNSWWEDFERTDSIDETLLTPIHPNDPMAEERQDACIAYSNRLTTEEKYRCYLAAIGHPNEQGSRRYADRIAEVYSQGQRLTIRKDLETVFSSTSEKRSIRTLQERFFPLESDPISIQNMWQHMTVDSLAIQVHTSEREEADTDHDVYFRINPRQGWKLSQSFTDDMDFYDDFSSGAVTRYALDPADGNESNRLHISDIEELRLSLKYDIVGGLTGEWKPKRIKLEVNGVVVWDEFIHEELTISKIDGHPVDHWNASYPKK